MSCLADVWRLPAHPVCPPSLRAWSSCLPGPTTSRPQPPPTFSWKGLCTPLKLKVGPAFDFYWLQVLASVGAGGAGGGPPPSPGHRPPLRPAAWHQHTPPGVQGCRGLCWTAAVSKRHRSLPTSPHPPPTLSHPQAPWSLPWP